MQYVVGFMKEREPKKRSSAFPRRLTNIIALEGDNHFDAPFQGTFFISLTRTRATPQEAHNSFILGKNSTGSLVVSIRISSNTALNLSVL